MSNQLVVNQTASAIEIALLHDGKLIELHKETAQSSFQVGDFYLGKIRKVHNSLNAAFVDIGADKDGFLTYFDLGPDILSLKKFTKLALEASGRDLELDKFQNEPQTVKTGRISQVFKSGEIVLVQVLKESISSKGPKLTCELSIPGRYFVLVPFTNTISISRKIDSQQEKKRLKDLALSIKPNNFGIIVRTNAEGVDLVELDKDLRSLIKKWDLMVGNLRKSKAGDLVLGDGNRMESILRDNLNDSFSLVAVNNSELAGQMKLFMQKVLPGSEKLLKLHSLKQPIFEHYKVQKQIQQSFGKNVSFGAGAYLVVEHTEALHVIDVNSGYAVFDNQKREENILKINLEAAQEVARQVRLRDMGGMIVVDFIDMKDPKHKNDLYHALRIAMSTDKARHTILPMSKFGLVQITRERVRPAVEINTEELCYTCNGTGKAEASNQLFSRLENTLFYLWNTLNHKKITLHANPIVVGYLKQGFPSLRLKWWMKHKKWLKLIEHNKYAMNQFEFTDRNNQKITGE